MECTYYPSEQPSNPTFYEIKRRLLCFAKEVGRSGIDGRPVNFFGTTKVRYVMLNCRSSGQVAITANGADWPG